MQFSVFLSWNFPSLTTREPYFSIIILPLLFCHYFLKRCVCSRMFDSELSVWLLSIDRCKYGDVGSSGAVGGRPELRPRHRTRCWKLLWSSWVYGPLYFPCFSKFKTHVTFNNKTKIYPQKNISNPCMIEALWDFTWIWASLHGCANNWGCKKVKAGKWFAHFSTWFAHLSTYLISTAL